MIFGAWSKGGNWLVAVLPWITSTALKRQLVSGGAVWYPRPNSCQMVSRESHFWGYIMDDMPILPKVLMKHGRMVEWILS